MNGIPRIEHEARITVSIHLIYSKRVRTQMLEILEGLWLCLMGLSQIKIRERGRCK